MAYQRNAGASSTKLVSLQIIFAKTLLKTRKESYDLGRKNIYANTQKEIKMTIAMQADDFFNAEFPTPVTTLEYGDEFGSVGLREKAIGARNNSFTLPSFVLNRFLKFSDKYYGTCEQFLREFGTKKGKAKFDSWTKLETFGIPNKMLSLARDFSPWFRNLSKHLQNLVCQRILELNINILKKLITLPADLLEKLLTSKEKITVAIINKMLAAISPPQEKQLKLRKNSYAQVVTPGHRLEGEIGQLQYKPDELGNIILVMFSGGPEEPLKIADVKPVPKPNNQFNQVDKKYNFSLEEKNQEIDEKNREIEYLQKAIETLTSQRENQVSIEHINSEKKIEKSDEKIEEDLITKITTEIEAAKAAEIVLIQAKAKEELKKRKQEWDQKYQKYLENVQAQKLETARLQAEQLKAAEAEAQKWQERAQNLEKMMLESPTKREKDLGTKESFVTENTELKKQVRLLLEKNAELEKASEQETALPDLNKYETISMSQKLEGLSEEFTELLELTTEEMITELVKLGFPGWREDGYHAKNNTVYPGYLGIKVFLDEKLSNNRQTLKNSASLLSSAKILEYSGRMPTSA